MGKSLVVDFDDYSDNDNEVSSGDGMAGFANGTVHAILGEKGEDGVSNAGVPGS